MYKYLAFIILWVYCTWTRWLSIQFGVVHLVIRVTNHFGGTGWIIWVMDCEGCWICPIWLRLDHNSCHQISLQYSYMLCSKSSSQQKTQREIWIQVKFETFLLSNLVTKTLIQWTTYECIRSFEMYWGWMCTTYMVDILTVTLWSMAI